MPPSFLACPSAVPEERAPGDTELLADLGPRRAPAHCLGHGLDAGVLPYLPEAARVVATALQGTVETVGVEVAAGITELHIGGVAIAQVVIPRLAHVAPPKRNRPFAAVGDVAGCKGAI